MMTIINQVLLIIAILTTAVVYGTDMFHALVVRKATALSKDQSIIDLIGHTHLIADKRMPVIGVTSVVSTILCIILNFSNTYALSLLVAALLMLLFHLYIYMTIAKPINIKMTEAAIQNIVPSDSRVLQNRWESVINYRAAFLTAAMLLLVIVALVI